MGNAIARPFEEHARAGLLGNDKKEGFLYMKNINAKKQAILRLKSGIRSRVRWQSSAAGGNPGPVCAAIS
jgi:hypothetical protein